MLGVPAIARPRPRRLAQWPSRAWKSISSAIVDATEQRRLFVLLPSSLILGLVIYALLPSEPEPFHFIIGSLLVTGCLTLAMLSHSLAGLRVAIQLSALWLGFCLLALHGLAFGTAMLSVPAYGTYNARVDEVLSAECRRVLYDPN